MAFRSRMSILVVEDDVSIRETLGLILEACDHEPVLTGCAEEALAYLEACEQENWPESILVDLTLPGINGDEFFFEVGRRFPNVPPTILMTAAAPTHQKLKYLNGSLFLPKPFTLEELTAALDTVTRTAPRKDKDPGLTCQTDFSRSICLRPEAALI